MSAPRRSGTTRPLADSVERALAESVAPAGLATEQRDRLRKLVLEKARASRGLARRSRTLERVDFISDGSRQGLAERVAVI